MSDQNSCIQLYFELPYTIMVGHNMTLTSILTGLLGLSFDFQ